MRPGRSPTAGGDCDAPTSWGEWVQFSEYTDECYADPTWGSNPDATHDCGKPHGWIKKVGWNGGEEKWPGAYAAIRKFTIDNKTVGGLIAEVDLEGKPLEEVVAGWMQANEPIWRAWIARSGSTLPRGGLL